MFSTLLAFFASLVLYCNILHRWRGNRHCLGQGRIPEAGPQRRGTGAGGIRAGRCLVRGGVRWMSLEEREAWVGGANTIKRTPLFSRGICIRSSNSVHGCRDLLDYLPKLALSLRSISTDEKHASTHETFILVPRAIHDIDNASDVGSGGLVFSPPTMTFYSTGGAHTQQSTL